MAALSTPLQQLSVQEQHDVEARLVAFDRSWKDGLLAEAVQELEPAGAQRAAALIELVKVDLEHQWGQGRQAIVEDYLRQYPELGSAETAAVDLVQAEFEVRQQFGSTAELADFARRFPCQAEALRELLSEARRQYSAADLGHARRSTPGPVGETRIPARQLSPIPERIGRYHIVKRLGHGGMGSVYLAEDTQLDRRVAVKVPHFSEHDGPQVRERFFREARAAATLEHPNLCPVYDVGELDGVPYLTMAFVEGRPLSEFIQDGMPLSPHQAANIVRKLALALREAHERGVIHRDLKPSNVMINQRHEPVVMDFGLARRVYKEEARITQSGSMLGTPAYMPPEQVNGDLEAMGPRSDVYSLGVILFELLTGKLPFQGTAVAVMAQILFHAPPPPSSLRPDIDPELEAICLRAMARKLDDRYGSMAELATALAGYLRAGSRSTANPELAAGAGPFAMLESREQAVAVPAVAGKSRQVSRWAWAATLLVGTTLLCVAGVVIVIRGKLHTTRITVEEGTGKAVVEVTPDKVVVDGDANVKVEVERNAKGAPKLPGALLAEVTGKAAAPEARDVAGFKLQLREAYKAELASPKTDDLTRLTKKLLASAEAPEVEPAIRFALLELASELCGQAGDYATGLDAVDRLARAFQIDVFKRQADVLTTSVHKVPSEAVPHRAFVWKVLEIGYKALAADAVTDAERLAALAQQVTGDRLPALGYQAEHLAEEAALAQRAQTRVKPAQARLQVSPDDGEANVVVALYHCLVKHDWTTGLPLLTRSTDQALQALAVGERTKSSDVGRQFALAEAWWNEAERRPGDEALLCRRRARHWYLRALPGMTGDASAAQVARAVTRIDSLPQRPVMLRIMLEGAYGSQHLRIAPDGIEHTNSHGVRTTRINHLEWSGKIRDFHNAGAQRLLPDAIDFTTADVRQEQVHSWGFLNFRVNASSLELHAHNPTSSRIDFAVTITFHCQRFSPANRFAGVWKAQFFKFSPETTDWNAGKPIKEVTLPSIGLNYRWGESPPFSARREAPFALPTDWVGMVATTEWDLPAGRYEIQTHADDGIRVYVDDRRVVDRWPAPHKNRDHAATVTLTAGPHRFRVEFCQHTSLARLRFFMRRAGDP